MQEKCEKLMLNERVQTLDEVRKTCCLCEKTGLDIIRSYISKNDNWR